MPCPLVFHSQPFKQDRFSAEKDQCGYCGKMWAATFPNKAKHLLGNSDDGSAGARYKNQGNMKGCEQFSLEDKKQLLGPTHDSNP